MEVDVMQLMAWTLALIALAPPAPARKSEARLAELAAAVLSADYRGDRPELARLDTELSRLDAATLPEYRDYWRGFALWRRAMNGFNETPTPGDLGSDLEKAVARFKGSLAVRPEWIEARLALAGCWGNLLYLAAKDEEKKRTILEEAVPTLRWVMENAGDNPRALWIKGGFEFWRGDAGKAGETLRQGVANAWREALASPPPPSWIPTWGGPENLMNLAYMYGHAAKPDRALALAYADGALTSVPQWHYVRDVLLPQIEALPEPAAPVPTAATP